MGVLESALDIIPMASLVLLKLHILVDFLAIDLDEKEIADFATVPGDMHVGPLVVVHDHLDLQKKSIHSNHSCTSHE